MASMCVSSAYDWYSYEQSGGFAGGGDDDENVPMSFQGDPVCGKWCKVGFADLAGAVWGALVTGGNPFAAIVRGTVVSLIAAGII